MAKVIELNDSQCVCVCSCLCWFVIRMSLCVFRYLWYVVLFSILFWFWCTVRMCDCWEAVLWNVIVSIVVMAQSCSSLWHGHLLSNIESVWSMLLIGQCLAHLTNSADAYAAPQPPALQFVSNSTLLVAWSSFIEYSFCLEHAVYFTVLGSLEANAPVAAKPSQNELHFVPWTSFILGRNWGHQ